jgi:hypothetical protein
VQSGSLHRRNCQTPLDAFDYFAWGVTPFALGPDGELSAWLSGLSVDGVPSSFFHRSITPPVPGVRVLDTAWSLQPAYSLIAQFHALAHFVLVAGPGFEPG